MLGVLKSPQVGRVDIGAVAIEELIWRHQTCSESRLTDTTGAVQDQKTISVPELRMLLLPLCDLGQDTKRPLSSRQLEHVSFLPVFQRSLVAFLRHELQHSHVAVCVTDQLEELAFSNLQRNLAC